MGVSFLAIDFSDAFYNIPLLPSERCFYVVYFRGRWYCLLRVAMGSRNGPQLWGRAAALAGRLAQPNVDPQEARIHMFVEGPIVTITADPMRVNILIAIAMLVWLALGLRPADHKGQFGTKVTWVGHSITATRKQVTATIKHEDFLIDFRTKTLEVLKQNVLSLDALHSNAGSANHIARLR